MNLGEPKRALRFCGHTLAKGQRREGSRRAFPLVKVVTPLIELFTRGQTMLRCRVHYLGRVKPIQHELVEETNILGRAKRVKGTAGTAHVYEPGFARK